MKLIQLSLFNLDIFSKPSTKEEKKKKKRRKKKGENTQPLIEQLQINFPLPPRIQILAKTKKEKGKLLLSLLNKKCTLWLREEVEALYAKQIACLCIVLGIPHSGTKKVKVDRLFKAIEVIKVVKEFDQSGYNQTPSRESAMFLADRYSSKYLRYLCKQVKIFIGYTKYMMATSLINWRHSSMKRGTKDYMDWLNEYKEKREARKNSQSLQPNPA